METQCGFGTVVLYSSLYSINLLGNKTKVGVAVKLARDRVQLGSVGHKLLDELLGCFKLFLVIISVLIGYGEAFGVVCCNQTGDTIIGGRIKADAN